MLVDFGLFGIVLFKGLVLIEFNYNFLGRVIGWFVSFLMLIVLFVYGWIVCKCVKCFYFFEVFGSRGG